MEDLNAASLEDVREWFKTYYGPSNAVIAVSGDIKAEEVKAKVEKYFGDIPPGPPIAKHQTWVAKRTGVQRQVLQDRVPQAKLYKVWNIPQWGTETADQLDLISDILGSGKTSRLYKRLVYQDQIATNVSVYTDLREIAGQFYIEATAKPGDDLKKIEQAIDEELAAFLKNGPTEKELERVKTQYFANFLKGIERIGGFGGKSDILARNMVYAGTPDYYKTTLKHVQGVTAASIKKAANDWLSDGVYILEVYPFPEFTPLASGADRTKLPVMGENPAPKFPDVQKAELSNGLKIVLAERKSIPVVNMSLLVDAGYASDQFAKAGTAGLAMDMLDEGTKKLDALQISEELALLGASLGTGADLDYSRVSLSALKANIDKSLDIFADVVLNPSFPQEDFKRLQQQKLAQIQREKSTPVQMALRTFPQLLYGEGHAYGNPLTGSGTEDNVAKMTREDLMNFHKTWFKPNHSTLIVVGDITMPELKSKLEKLFASWKRGDIPQKNLSEVKQQPASKIYLIDRPGSLQSIIFAGHVVPPMDMKNETAVNSMNNILGGSFTSRINMNLREDKHWSYGASSFIWNAKGQRPFIVYTSVQTDKTKESVFEIKKELTQILAGKPVSQDEVDKVQKSQILEMPGSWE
ncbi:MAG TPA: insulinase family protein, partial [Ignavibacteriales bacterium]|nr:insulinase family protein [Ignavibacteriales bacterium]